MRFFAFFQWNKKKGVSNGLTGGLRAGILRKKGGVLWKSNGSF